MHKLVKFNIKEPQKGDRKISYSQFAMYSKCPKQWELAYIRGLRQFSQSIHTLFGTSFHETLQHYLTVMYEQTAKAADELDLNAMLQERMRHHYQHAVKEMDDHFSTKFELAEFYQDGVTILDYIKRHRSKYFSAKNEELVGIELPIYHPVNQDKGIFMLGYIDVILRDKRTDEITIIDIKTSTMGWNKYQKADALKSSQLVLYKEYFAKQFGFNVEKIKIKYMIVKRKLIEGAMFPQKRVQEHMPASGKPTRNKLNRSIDAWVETCFDNEGNYISDRDYVASAGKNKKNCKYCDFKDRDDLCPKANRIKE
jgi:RecB family exonuclease